MGKRFSNETSRIGESGGSACQRRCQEAIDALNKGEFERVVELLRGIEIEDLRLDQSYLISAAYQISLTCVLTKADLTWHHRAQQEAEQRVHEYQTQLFVILSLICKPESQQEIQKPELIPGPHTIPRPIMEAQTLEGQKRPGLWQRVRALLGSSVPPVAGERAILSPDIIDTQSQETPISIPKVEGPSTPHLESERTSKQEHPSLIIYCLGPFRVYQQDKELTEWHSFKGRDLFKYLLVRRGTPSAKDILIDVFWPDADPKAARRNLHQTIYSLRQTLRGENPGFQYIWFENDCYFLNPQVDVWLDYIEFEKYVEAGHQLESAGRIGEAIEQYGTAEGLYQGDFLEEDLYVDWPVIQREQLLNLYISAVDQLCELYFRNQQYAAVVPLCQKVLSKDKCYEAAHRRLMQCYLAFGQRHLAVRQYQTCVKALREDLDIPPSEETVAMYHRMMSKGE